jgi:hypothetical protein
MRHTLNAIDPLPEFPCDGLSFELQDSEPAYQPCERHKRLPSYREAQAARWAREDVAMSIKLARRGMCGGDSKQHITEIARFNGNCNPNITEAACRQIKSAPAEQPKQATDAPKFKVGDRVRTIKSVGDVVVGDEFTVVGLEVLGLSTHVRVKGRVHVYLFEHHLELLPAEPAPQEPQADADGWIEWKGGKCPIPKETPVVVRLRDGSEYDGETAADWVWAHVDSVGDIVAYRIVA